MLAKRSSLVISGPIILMVVLLLFVGIMAAWAQDGAESTEPACCVTIRNSETMEVTSSRGEDYVISIRLPEFYILSGEQGESYPVLYLLDPDTAFGMASDFARLMRQNNGRLSELIIVGIGYPTTESGFYMDQRSRDYRPGGADDFLDFVGDDLIPLIDSNYRTQPGERTLAGHSLGGGLALKALTERPELFNGYISISALTTEAFSTGLNNILNGNDEDFRAGIAGKDVRVFLASAEGESAVTVISQVQDALDAGNYEEIETTVFTVDDETHLSVMPIALTRGMRTLFDRFR